MRRLSTANTSVVVVVVFVLIFLFCPFAAWNNTSTAIMRKIFLYQVYTNLAYLPPTYRRVKKLPILMINKDVRKPLARKREMIIPFRVGTTQWTLVPQFSKNLRVAWLVNSSSFSLFTKLPLIVSMTLNWWKVEIISDPYKYLLWIVGFYHRSVLFFLYGLQFNSYFKNIPIWNIVSWCSNTGSILSMEYRHYRFKNIFMARDD